ncbi:methyltransferase type 11 [Actinorhabdospora filicis]|uniref:Methyltransferase type 11 n=1 Tax=Actinorhabdospora filicis TaxID=1785913 RepID=A0A9W6SKZ3_9ACTN|nr:class I SAM-dependent methyltransferase [Actinorhabdospora filicis]GLZ77847.1 methyltransferase type 11 [Actinorhabdospora filicis]
MTVTTWDQDVYADAMRTGRGPLYLRRPDGWLLPLDVERWCGHVDATDRLVLARCAGPVLDVGCGPGRFAAALARLGVPALGVDTCPSAVARAIAAGGAAECRSVFEPLPGEGAWRTLLLMDGNIGIGGDPLALLRRLRGLARPGALLMVETAPVDVDERLAVHVDNGRGGRGRLFPWARLGPSALRRAAGPAGWRVAEEWTCAERAFTALRPVR